MQTATNSLHPWEGQELVAAVRRVQGVGVKVTFDMMIEWKRGRGMCSSADMNSERKRVAWLRAAMRCLEANGITI